MCSAINFAFYLFTETFFWFNVSSPEMSLFTLCVHLLLHLKQHQVSPYVEMIHAQ